jgi:hypothetical protein
MANMGAENEWLTITLEFTSQPIEKDVDPSEDEDFGEDDEDE